MKKMQRKGLSIFLSLLMLLSSLPPFTTVWAAQDGFYETGMTENMDYGKLTAQDEVNGIRTAQGEVDGSSAAQNEFNESQTEQSEVNETQPTQNEADDIKTTQNDIGEIQTMRNQVYGLQAAQNVIYEPMTTEYGIFNRFNYGDLDYYKDYAKSSPFYNAVAKFNGLAPQWTFRNTYPSDLSKYVWPDFGRQKIKDAGGNETEVLTAYGRIAEAGQLEYNIGATIHVNKHSHWHEIFKETTFVYPYITFWGGKGSVRLTAFGGYDLRNDGTKTVRMGDDTGPSYSRFPSVYT